MCISFAGLPYCSNVHAPLPGIVRDKCQWHINGTRPTNVTLKTCQIFCRGYVAIKQSQSFIFYKSKNNIRVSQSVMVGHKLYSYYIVKLYMNKTMTTSVSLRCAVLFAELSYEATMTHRVSVFLPETLLERVWPIFRLHKNAWRASSALQRLTLKTENIARDMRGKTAIVASPVDHTTWMLKTVSISNVKRSHKKSTSELVRDGWVPLQHTKLWIVGWHTSPSIMCGFAAKNVRSPLYWIYNPQKTDRTPGLWKCHTTRTLPRHVIPLFFYIFPLLRHNFNIHWLHLNAQETPW